MNRVPYAVRTFAGQVLARYPLTEIDYDNADGFGVYRTLVIKGDALEWFQSVIEVITLDERIDTFSLEDGGLSIHFVTDIRADNGKPFPLREIENRLTKIDEEDDFRKNLMAMKVAELREKYPVETEGVTGKATLVDAILAAQ